MIKKLSKNWLLIIIILLASILRLYHLDEVPPHLTSDEAALGYNAYSILKTAKDEHGRFLPIIFESFGDWKPGLYVYLDVPFVALLGLNEFSARAPGAISGIIAVFLIYLVVLKLFNNRTIALFSAFFLSISPWHLQFSRGAWEAGVSMTLVLAGIHFFLLALEKKSLYLVLSSVFFALTLWTYQGAKMSTSIVVVLLVIMFFAKVVKLSKKALFISLAAGLIIALPIIMSIMQGQAGRLTVFSVFSYPRPEEYIQENILSQEQGGKDSVEYALYHSEKLHFLRGVIGRWTNHFSGRFLFFEGDWSNQRHTAPYSGVAILLDSLFLILGIGALARFGNKGAAFVLLWLLLAPLSAALSRDSVHAVRSLNMVIPLVIILAWGANVVLQIATTQKLIGKAILGIFCLFYLFNYMYYLDEYWIDLSKRDSAYWQYGYKQIVEEVTALQPKYSEIVIQQDYAQPYIFFLFYQKYNPSRYQKMSKDIFVPSESGDVGLVTKLDNITFRPIDWRTDQELRGKLFIADLIRMPLSNSNDSNRFKLIDTIKFLNGKTAFRAVEVL